jgi:hypothetical protein
VRIRDFPAECLRKWLRELLLRDVFKKIFTNNFFAKVASLVLATLLWAVIKKSQLSDPAAAQPKPPELNVNFGAGAYGK